MDETTTRPVSWWQIGCNDARTGKQPAPPAKRARYHSPEHESYMNGYQYGYIAAQRLPADDTEGGDAN